MVKTSPRRQSFIQQRFAFCLGVVPVNSILHGKSSPFLCTRSTNRTSAQNQEFIGIGIGSVVEIQVHLQVKIPEAGFEFLKRIRQTSGQAETAGAKGRLIDIGGGSHL